MLQLRFPLRSTLRITDIVATLLRREIETVQTELIHQRAETKPQSRRKVLEVGLIGIPNAGKSELTNQLVGQKITAVSSKQNTTIKAHLGAFEVGNTQVVLYDLPGIVRSKDVRFKGQQARVESAWSTAVDCDVVTFIVDTAYIKRYLFRGSIQGNGNAHHGEILVKKEAIEAIPTFALAKQLREDLHINKDLSNKSRHLILVLNKIDLVEPNERYKLAYIEELLGQHCPFRETFHLSALRGIGISALKSHFLSLVSNIHLYDNLTSLAMFQARVGEWILPSGAKTDKSPGELAVELVREKLYRRLNEELPYSLLPELVEEAENESGAMFIDILIRVPSESVKKIVVGRRGAIIQNYVIARTRNELQMILKRRIILKINVKTSG